METIEKAQKATYIPLGKELMHHIEVKMKNTVLRAPYLFPIVLKISNDYLL
jgi:hypothetical protein